MELSEETQECPYCGLCYTDFEFHIRIHDDCKMLEEQRKALGRKREDMLGLEDALRLVDSHLQPSVDEEEDGGEAAKRILPFAQLMIYNVFLVSNYLYFFM